MSNLKMFCLSMESKHLEIIKKLNYLPVGLGKQIFTSEWFRDNTGENINEKNNYYGEYTFHYWLWKNYLDKIEDEWVGFCQYRKFWTLDEKNILPKTFDELEKSILKKIPDSYKNFETILGNEYLINQLRVMKFFKRGAKLILKNPSILFNSSKRNIKFHFDMWHGPEYLEKAIQLLDQNDRQDFIDFVDSKISFNPHNMFICKSKEKIKKYYETVFPWLKRCENEFGFKDLKGYGKVRIYGFLAERFMSYWFQKNTLHKTMQISFYDIGNDIL